MPKGVTKNGLWRGREPLSIWVEREQAAEPLCACGCGDRIIVQPHHRAYGVPRVLVGHHARGGGHALERHPNWHADRRNVRGGRGGAYFTPSIRRAALARAEGRCTRCASVEKPQVDHIVAVADGGEATLTNAQVLCHRCHADKASSERRQRRMR
jgi:5-methylcytosine-specific restriction protein A